MSILPAPPPPLPSATFQTRESQCTLLFFQSGLAICRLFCSVGRVSSLDRKWLTFVDALLDGSRVSSNLSSFLLSFSLPPLILRPPPHCSKSYPLSHYPPPPTTTIVVGCFYTLLSKLSCRTSHVEVHKSTC